MIEAVYFYRVLTTHQLQQLFFSEETAKSRQARQQYQERTKKPIKNPGAGRRKRCEGRLRLLFCHGYLSRGQQLQRPSDARLPLLHTLDAKGRDLLAAEFKVSPREIEKRSNPHLHSTSNSFLTHQLRLNDVVISLSNAAKRHGVVIRDLILDYSFKRDHDRVTLLTNPKDPESSKIRVAVIPDAYCWLWTGSKNFHQFLEVDLRTVVGRYSKEGGKDWVRRVRAYREYFDSGLYRQRFPDADKSMRVLIITTGETRLANIEKEAIVKVAGKRKPRFWLTTFERLTSDTILTEPVWKVAGKDEVRPLVW
jgi:hypothetical protein